MAVLRWFLLIIWAAGVLRAAEDARPIVRFGIPPWQKSQSVDEIREQYRGVLEWLAERLEVRFVLVGGRSYEDLIELVAQGNVQLASLSPVPYVQAKRKCPGLRLLGTELKWNADHSRMVDVYQGYVVVRGDRADLRTAVDLRGKRIAAVNLESSSGWRYPYADCLAAGIDLRREATVLFLGSHPRVTDALVAGSVDAALTWDYNLAEARRKHGDVFRVLLSTVPIPNICLVAHPSLDPALARRISDLLSTADPAVFANAPMQGYAVRPDAYYDPVRRLLDGEAQAAPEPSPP